VKSSQTSSISAWKCQIGINSKEIGTIEVVRLIRKAYVCQVGKTASLSVRGSRELKFFGDLVGLVDPDSFVAHLAPLRKTEGIVYSKPPFGGPEAALAYLSRYTHRVAISSHRLVSTDADTVAFRWKDYRIKRGDRMKTRRLPMAGRCQTVSNWSQFSANTVNLPSAKLTPLGEMGWLPPSPDGIAMCQDCGVERHTKRRTARCRI
jgi:hypothetical protein